MPTSVTVLTREDFAARPSFTVADALEGVMSLDIQREGGRGTTSLAKIRGSSSRRTIVLMDGIPLTHEFDGAVDLSQIPLAMVDRIEITRGGGSTSYGSEATGGQINIITARPVQKGLLVDLGMTIGNYGSQDLNGRIIGRSYLADATYATSQQHSSGFSNNEDMKANNHFVNISRSFKGQGYWGAEYFFHDSENGISNGTPVPFDEWNSHAEKVPISEGANRQQEWQHLKLMAGSPKIHDTTFHASFTQSWRNLQMRDLPDGPALLDEDNKATTVDLKAVGKLCEAGFQSRSLERSVYARPNESSGQEGLYVFKKWAKDGWTVVPGLRYDHIENDAAVNPRLSVLYTPAQTWLLSSNLTRTFRAPTFDELFVDSTTLHNSELKAEHGLSYDAGMSWQPLTGTKWTLTGFASHVTDLVTANSANQWSNEGHERTRGIETELSTRLGSVGLSTNWTHQKAQRKTSASADYVTSALTPTDLSFTRLDYYFLDSMKLTNELRYQSEQFSNDDKQGTRIPGYYVWNIRYSLRILKADMYAEIENVNRRRYADAVAASLVPQPSRTFWTGINIQFAN